MIKNGSLSTYIKCRSCARCPCPQVDDCLAGNMAVAGGKLIGTIQDQVVMVKEVVCELDMAG